MTRQSFPAMVSTMMNHVKSEWKRDLPGTHASKESYLRILKTQPSSNKRWRLCLHVKKRTLYVSTDASIYMAKAEVKDISYLNSPVQEFYHVQTVGWEKYAIKLFPRSFSFEIRGHEKKWHDLVDHIWMNLSFKKKSPITNLLQWVNLEPRLPKKKDWS